MADQIKREISIMKLVRHPCVVRLYEVLASRTKIYIILEYITGGELFDKIFRNGRLSESEARKYFQQLIDGVDYCHSKGVYHRDLKPENLLLDSQGNLKISDFGLSAIPEQGVTLLKTTCGTPNYVAPEVLSHKGYNGAVADVWSCEVGSQGISQSLGLEAPRQEESQGAQGWGQSQYYGDLGSQGGQAWGQSQYHEDLGSQGAQGWAPWFNCSS